MLDRLISRRTPTIHVLTLIIAVAIGLGFPGRALCAERTGSEDIGWEYQMTYQRVIADVRWSKSFPRLKTWR